MFSVLLFNVKIILDLLKFKIFWIFFIIFKYTYKVGEIYYTNKLSHTILNEYYDDNRGHVCYHLFRLLFSINLIEK